jgi:hypothetical protein
MPFSTTPPDAWLSAPEKRLSVFGMSGLGKTRLASLMRDQGEWFHYSIDYRIGTAYMGEHITDNLKRQAMKVPFLADLLRSDSIYIGSNITFGNLAPLSTFLGKPGDTAKGGLPFEEYMRRQDLHRRAEINALLDTPSFISRARDLYGYPNVVCDTGGSICEVVDPDDPEDEVLRTLSAHTLMVWIEGTEAHTDELIRRFDAAPKPMYYQPDFLCRCGGATSTHRPRARRGGSRRLRALRLCPRAGPSRAALRRDGAELGNHRHRRGGRVGARRRRCLAWWPRPLADTAQTA